MRLSKSLSKNKMIRAVCSEATRRSTGPRKRAGADLRSFFSFLTLSLSQVNEEVDYDRVMKSGYMEKKKVGAKKWEKRFCLLTLGHLSWFEDYEAREKQKPKGVIDLREVKVISLKKVDGESGRGDVLFLELDQQTYMFGDNTNVSQNVQWRDQINFVMKQLAAIPKDQQTPGKARKRQTANF